MSELSDLIKGGLVNQSDMGEVIIPDTKEEQKPIEETKPITTEKVIETKEQNFDLGSFNKKFSRDFADEDSLVQAIERASKYGELEPKYQELTTKYSEIEEVAKRGTDPLSWFANEDEYIRQQFLLKKGDKFSPDALNVLTRLTPSSIDKMNAWEVLKTDLLVNNEIEGGMEAVQELLMDKYGVDTDNFDEFDQKTRNLIKLDSQKAKLGLKSVYDGIELPRKVDFETSRTQLKEVWQTPLQEIVKGIDTIKIADGIDFSVPDDLKEGLLEETMNELLKSRTSPSVDAGVEIASKLRSKILERGMDKVVAHIKSTVEAQVKEQYRAKVENTEPVNNSSRQGQTDDTSDAVGWLLNK